MKKPNIKVLVVDHGEKIVLGFFALIVLVVLAQTSWGRFPKSPDELKRSVADVRSKISDPKNFWPKEEEASFKVVDFSEKSRILFTPLVSLASGRFDFSTPLFHPLYRKDEPKREPVYESVQFLIAKTGIAPLSLVLDSDGSLPTEEDRPAAEEKKPEMDDPEFRERPGVAAAAGPLGIGRPPAAPGTGNRPAGTAAGAKSNAPTLFTGMPGGMSGGGAGPQGPEIKVRGERYISVRGVFPLRKQIENFKRALHLPEAEAAALVEIIDFVLERQVAGPGPDPWKDREWKAVSISKAAEILGESSDLDPLDPVPIALQDAVITMPLPMRLLFTWGESATHPKIKDEELKRDEIEQQEKLLEAMDKTASETNLTEAKPDRKGFAITQRDFKIVANQIKNNPDSLKIMKDMYKQSGTTGGPGMPGTGRSTPPGPMMGAGGGPGAMRGSISMDRLVISARYLLFRYLDFDVESGMAYRYRVRLQLRNPNFELTPEELGIGDPEITKGPIRETPWSNISNPDVIPSTVNYFLARVDREPYAEDRVRVQMGKPVAQLKMFDWDTKLGTVITDFLNIPALGGFIGEARKDTVQLNLAAGNLEKKDHKFNTMNVLVDVESDVDVSAEQHPDLKLAAADKKGLARLGVLQEALVATESGELEALDPFSEKTDEQNWVRRTEAERRGFDFEDTAPKTGTGLDRLLPPGAETGAAKPKRGKTKKLKGKAAAAAAAGAGAGAGAMAAPGNAPGAPRRRTTP